MKRFGLRQRRLIACVCLWSAMVMSQETDDRWKILGAILLAAGIHAIAPGDDADAL
jgi:hypothetical protein